MKKQEERAYDIKTDLKHDTMEFSASTDGDDRLDTDDSRREDDGISSEELDALEDAGGDEMAIALSAAETDRLADNDNLPDESDEDDYYDDDTKVV